MALTKFNYNSFDVTPVASNAFAFNSTPNGLSTASSGAINLITTNTISSGVSSSSFTSSINSTYDTYLFKFFNIHPATNNTEFQVNFRDGSSAFDATKQSTCYQVIMQDPGNENDESGSGTLHLFDPSNTTFLKHFISDIHEHQGSNYAVRKFVAGYGNTTSAINAIDFKFASGNIDSGVIKLYGVS